MAPKARVQKRLYYKIGEACKALDIQPYVLRYWETEFPALSPNKSRSGQRVYSEKEIGIIRRIKELLYEEGYTIAGARQLLKSEASKSKDQTALPFAVLPDNKDSLKRVRQQLQEILTILASKNRIRGAAASRT